MEDTQYSIYTKYPWLKINVEEGEYMIPGYYDLLLKDYIYDSKEDVDFLKDYLMSLKTKDLKVLELGGGTGRVTDVALKNTNFNKYHVVDLSRQMIGALKKRFSDYKYVDYFNSDSINYLKNTNEKYDLIFSLWSFSHSVHKHLRDKGYKEGKEFVKNTIKKCLNENLNDNGKIFLMHYDSTSDEQRIFIRHRKKIDKVHFSEFEQSPSKKILDEVLLEMKKEGNINFSLSHYIGEEIEYENMNLALETSLNLHMESHYNNLPCIEEIIEDMTEYYEQYVDSAGVVRIKPGCFIYLISKT